MIHSSKQAYVAIADHRDGRSRFSAGDIVIIDDEALVDLLTREGSIDPAIVVTAAMFLGGPETPETAPETAPKASAGDSPAAAHDRMTRAPAGRRGAAGKFAAKPADGDSDGGA